jgi:hypothetical protein
MRCVQLVVKELEAPVRVIEEVEGWHAVPDFQCPRILARDEYTWPHPDSPPCHSKRSGRGAEMRDPTKRITKRESRKFARVCRKPLDAAPVSADPRPHRATREAPHLITAGTRSEA